MPQHANLSNTMIGASCGPLCKLTPKHEQKHLIEQLFSDKPSKDVFLLPKPWLDNWETYVSCTHAPTPGSVRTKSLLVGSGLRNGTLKGRDYVEVDDRVLAYFEGWYGIADYIIKKI